MKSSEIKKGGTYIFEFKHSAFGGGIRETKCTGTSCEGNMVKMNDVWWEKDKFLEDRKIIGEVD